MTAAEIIAANLDHPAWVAQVVEWCHLGGWLVYVMHDSRRQHWGSDTGWPDIFAVRGDQAIAAELKTGRGQPRPDQRAWLAALGAAHIRAVVWHPRDALYVRDFLTGGIPARQLVMSDMIRKARNSRPRKSPLARKRRGL